MTPALSGFRNLRRSFYRSGVTGWKFERTLIFVSLASVCHRLIREHKVKTVFYLEPKCDLDQGSCGFEPVRVKRHLRVFD